MNHNNFHTIDPSQSHLPDGAVIQKVLSDNEQLPTEQHDQAVRAFFVSWDGKGLSIVHVGDTEVTLQDELEQFIQLKKTLFLNLVQQW